MKTYQFAPDDPPKIWQIIPTDGWILFQCSNPAEKWSWEPVAAFGLVEGEIVPLCDSYGSGRGTISEAKHQTLAHWSTVLTDWTDAGGIHNWDALERYIQSQYGRQQTKRSK